MMRNYGPESSEEVAKLLSKPQESSPWQMGGGMNAVKCALHLDKGANLLLTEIARTVC